MNRRTLLQLLFFSSLNLACNGGAPSRLQGSGSSHDPGSSSGVSLERSESLVLKDFLTGESGLTREQVQPILAYVYNGHTNGSGFHLGDGIFLTNNHVVSGSMRIINPNYVTPELTRVSTEREFTILHGDADKDLALLKTPWGSPTGRAVVHLHKERLSIGDTVSIFENMNGYLRERREFSYNGVDFFDNSIPIENLGRIIQEAESTLIERQGEIYPITAEKVLETFGSFRGCNPYTDHLSSISAFNGDSGYPVFLKRGQNYFLVGVTRAALGVLEGQMIETPRDMLGYSRMQQTGASFVRADIITEFICDYLSAK